MNFRPYIAITFLALTGCVSHIGDLQRGSVEAVRYDQTELRKPQNDNLAHQTVLKVEFTSQTDLVRFISRGDYNLGVSADFCNPPVAYSHQVFMSFQGVYWRGLEIGNTQDLLEIGRKNAKEPITYYTFFAVARKAVTPSNPPEISFDLRNQPEDICFRLRGGNEAGGFWSNKVLIPKSIIAAALQNVPANSN